jgi:hypothetical protein
MKGGESFMPVLDLKSGLERLCPLADYARVGLRRSQSQKCWCSGHAEKSRSGI